MPTRLNKYLATHLGISRREADDLIATGQVTLNGQPAALGSRIHDGPDEKIPPILIRGKPITPVNLTYLALNKPTGYVSSRKHQDKTPTLYDLLPPEYQNLKTVGRLDKDSSGLILLTNDGDFAFRMTHPSFAKAKEYLVTLDHPLAPLHQQMLADIGVQLPDGISQLGLTPQDDTKKHWQVALHEGRNRQIRRSFGALGYTVTALHRTSFGLYQLADLPSGHHQILPAPK